VQSKVDNAETLGNIRHARRRRLKAKHNKTQKTKTMRNRDPNRCLRRVRSFCL